MKGQQKPLSIEETYKFMETNSNNVGKNLRGENFCLQSLAAEWQSEKFGKETKTKVLQNEFLMAVKSINVQLKESGNEKMGIEWMNWDKLYEVSAEFMDLYSKEMEEILAELDEVYKKWFMWQEAAFTIDSHRGATRIGKAESWIKSKELHLKHTRNELDSSAKVIRTTIEDLSRQNVS